jgi:cardiolipin synthase
MLHAKYLIVDEHVAAIGSANMDVRSFYINYEVTAMFYNQAVTSDLAAVFESDMERAVEVRPEDRRSLPVQDRLAENFARLLSPLL